MTSYDDYFRKLNFQGVADSIQQMKDNETSKLLNPLETQYDKLQENINNLTATTSNEGTTFGTITSVAEGLGISIGGKDALQLVGKGISNAISKARGNKSSNNNEEEPEFNENEEVGGEEFGDVEMTDMSGRTNASGQTREPEIDENAEAGGDEFGDVEMTDMSGRTNTNASAESSEPGETETGETGATAGEGEVEEVASDPVSILMNRPLFSNNGYIRGAKQNTEDPVDNSDLNYSSHQNMDPESKSDVPDGDNVNEYAYSSQNPGEPQQNPEIAESDPSESQTLAENADTELDELGDEATTAADDAAEVGGEIGAEVGVEAGEVGAEAALDTAATVAEANSADTLGIGTVIGGILAIAGAVVGAVGAVDETQNEDKIEDDEAQQTSIQEQEQSIKSSIARTQFVGANVMSGLTSLSGGSVTSGAF